jgi:hypothetical protein
MSELQPNSDPTPETPRINPASAGGTEPPDDGLSELEALAREVIAQFGPGQDGYTRFRICARSAYRQDVSATANDATVTHDRADPDQMHDELREIFDAAAQEYRAAYHANR